MAAHRSFKPWSPEEERTLAGHYDSGTPVPAICKLMKRSRASIDGKAAELGLRDVARRQQARAHTLSDPQHHYRNGIRTRQKGRGKTPPPGLGPVLRAWFLAGWHDADMGLQEATP